MNWKIERLQRHELDITRPLWEKLNAMHLDDSRYFKEHFRSFTFEKRTAAFREKSDDDILIQVVLRDNGLAVGYCISTVDGVSGELDSLYLEEEYRSRGIGRIMVEACIAWFNDKKCSRVVVAIADGHESVFPFYRKFGFYPRLTYLQLKDK